MNCQQVQAILEALSLPHVPTRQYTALQAHAQQCAPCQQHWQQWLDHEHQLANLLTVEQAPAGTWENIMTQIETRRQTHGDAANEPVVSVETSPQGICRLVLRQSAPDIVAASETRGSAAASPLLARAHAQLAAYFRGERSIFQLPVDLRQCSDFERAVLAATATIPYGEVRSYKWIATQIGHPEAARAVGRALHNNPVPIVIPCHRVVKSDGSMGGYAFGQAWKTHLLTLERDTVPFVGCTSTRILCYRGCHHEQRIRAGNRVHFTGVSEAAESGYRPCHACQPA